MKGGTIVLCGGAELRTGAWMNRGTIISLTTIELLPTFAYASTYRPIFLQLYTRYLTRFGLTLPEGTFRRYTGDAAVPGKGEILVWSGAA